MGPSPDRLEPETGTIKNPVQTAGFGGIDVGEKSSARVDLRSPERELFATALRYIGL
jgi:hypothetical protein